jgi:ABC-type lipoprotein release transport system permease subunit
MARRITLYFFIFGLVIFFITTTLYMGGTRKHFIRSTSQLINHQFSLMESAQIPVRDIHPCCQRGFDPAGAGQV